MKFAVDSFANDGQIPVKYTCKGEGISPALSWSDLPPGTESLALKVFDPDAPNGNFTHWLIYNIKPEDGKIGENNLLTGIELKNSAGSKGWVAPCPPSGEHRYIFTLYSLGKELENVNENNFNQLVEEAKIDEETITGLVKA